MAKTNYSFERRQRDLAKKNKRDEKRLRKQERKGQPHDLEGGTEATPEAPETGDLPPDPPQPNP